MEIIPGLPNEISRECLLRVPCTSHYKLTSVRKSWESIVTSPLFYENRKKSGASQELIVLSVIVNEDYEIKLFDPLQKSLETLPHLPHRHTCFSHCVFVNHKLVVMGFHDREELLFVYDFRYGKWRRGADLPDRRTNFGCSVDSDKGLIYIAGGYGISPTEERITAAVYNVEEEKWEYLPPMIWSSHYCHSAFADKKLYVVGLPLNTVRLQCYDPNTRIWRHITAFRFNVICPPLPAFGQLFFVCESSVIEFDCVEKRPHICGTQLHHLSSVDGMTMWHGQIVTCGKDVLDGYAMIYLFEPGKTWKEQKWDLLKRWSPTMLGILLKCCGTLTL